MGLQLHCMYLRFHIIFTHIADRFSGILAAELSLKKKNVHVRLWVIWHTPRNIDVMQLNKGSLIKSNIWFYILSKSFIESIKIFEYFRTVAELLNLLNVLAVDKWCFFVVSDRSQNGTFFTDKIRNIWPKKGFHKLNTWPACWLKPVQKICTAVGLNNCCNRMKCLIL